MRAIVSPNPVPPESRDLEFSMRLNGWNTASNWSSGMPGPPSIIVITTLEPSCLTMIWANFPYLIALSSRLEMQRRRAFGLARIGRLTLPLKVTSQPASVASLQIASMSEFRSIGLKGSSELMLPANSNPSLTMFWVADRSVISWARKSSSVTFSRRSRSRVNGVCKSCAIAASI